MILNCLQLFALTRNHSHWLGSLRGAAAPARGNARQPALRPAPPRHRAAAGGCEVVEKARICRDSRHNAMGQHMASIPMKPTEPETE